jgi:hypothetical protein
MPVFNDTHELIKQLTSEGGMTERGAEILVTALNKGLTDAVATKADVALLKTDLKADIAATKADLAAARSDLKADIALLKAHVDGIEQRLTNKLYIVGIAMVGLIVTVQHLWK